MDGIIKSTSQPGKVHDQIKDIIVVVLFAALANVD